MPPKSRKVPGPSQRRGAAVTSDEETSTSETSEEEGGRSGRSKAKQKSSRTQKSNHSSNSSQSTSGSQGELSSALINRLTSDMVKYFLIANQQKHAIKRADISKSVMQEFSRHYNTVFGKAKEKLRQVFGLELKEQKKGCYLLVNSIEVNSENNHLTWSKEEDSKFGLLAVILTIIYMNGNRIPESELWSALKNVGIDKETVHLEFGVVNKLITKDFVRNMYLKYVKVPDSEPPTYEFEWGERAIEELEKKDLLDFVCQIYGNVNPDDWVSQYQETVAAAKKTS